MTLDQALMILALVHTGDDPDVGFVVHMGARPNLHSMTDADYVAAWKTVREHLHLQTEPSR